MTVRIEERAAGDSSRFLLTWKDKDGDPVNLAIFTAPILLRMERVGFAVLELPISITDAANGLGFFSPTPAQIFEGTHYYQVKGVVTSTTEEKYFPRDEPVTLKVSRALKDLS